MGFDLEAAAIARPHLQAGHGFAAVVNDCNAGDKGLLVAVAMFRRALVPIENETFHRLTVRARRMRREILVRSALRGQCERFCVRRAAEKQLVITLAYSIRVAIRHYGASTEKDAAVAKNVQGVDIVADDQNGLAPALEVEDPIE